MNDATSDLGRRPVRVGNFSGFYGDRFSALKEQLEGGDLDYLTGDYLAELTMLILYKSSMRNNKPYARTFIEQFMEVAELVQNKNVKIVTNAGGLDPALLARDLQEFINKSGLSLRVMAILGDDVRNQLSGKSLKHLDSGKLLDAKYPILTANAYLGCFPIVEALKLGADVVITGRVTDASLVMGPAAFFHNWSPEDLDQLAGALVAGHVIECGCQATGGNYSFFEETGLDLNLGFPIAEIYENGSSVITKHPNTGGVVNKGTVLSQILYEIQGALYFNPDVVADFSTIELEEIGVDRVQILGTRGYPPPHTYKVCINHDGGYKNSVTFKITGLQIEQKASWVRSQFLNLVGGANQFDEYDERLINLVQPNASRNEEAVADLRISVRSHDREKVGRKFSNAATELVLSSYPGFFLDGSPQDAKSVGIYFPTLISKTEVSINIYSPQLDTYQIYESPLAPATADFTRLNQTQDITQNTTNGELEAFKETETTSVPLGTIVGARSGDKGGNANIGLFCKNDEQFYWLSQFLTTSRLKELLPEIKDLKVNRTVFPKLKALNFVIEGILGEGVAASLRPDPQAKGLGEFLRSRHVNVPVSLLRS